MMTSPFDNVELVPAGVTTLPVRLLNREILGKKIVTRLEFHSAKQVVTEAAAVEVDSKLEAMEFQLKEELVASDERLQSQQISERIEAAKAESRVEARLDWEKELKERISDERKKVLWTCERFDQDRTRYFAGVESEVVKLALAIAARILHREAKLDPLLLAAAVRIALEKVERDSVKILRVPAAEVELWRTSFPDTAVSELSIQVVGDERLQVGECVLETNIGSVELGVSAQLSEIELGFFDLLKQRPV
jgi:flagellar assembly protein FliH